MPLLELKKKARESFEIRFRMKDAALSGKAVGHGLEAEIQSFLDSHLEEAWNEAFKAGEWSGFNQAGELAKAIL